MKTGVQRYFNGTVFHHWNVLKQSIVSFATFYPARSFANLAEHMRGPLVVLRDLIHHTMPSRLFYGHMAFKRHMCLTNKAFLPYVACGEFNFSLGRPQTQTTPVVSSLHRPEITFSLSRSQFPEELAHPTTQPYPQDEGIRMLKVLQTYRAQLKGGPQVWWTLFLLLLGFACSFRKTWGASFSRAL